MATKKIIAIGARVPEPVLIEAGKKFNFNEGIGEVVIEDISHKRDGVDTITKGDQTSCFLIKAVMPLEGQEFFVAIPDKEVYQIFFVEVETNGKKKGKHAEDKQIGGGPDA